MPLVRLLSTTTFRVALIYLLLFAASVLLVLAFIYWNTDEFMARETDETIAAEVRGLQERFERDRLRGLAEVIYERSRKPGSSLYLLADGRKRRIAGNLSVWPEAEPDPAGWIDFSYKRRTAGETEGESRLARGRVFLVGGSYYLIVGRDIHERREIEKSIVQNLASAMLLMIVLGLIGGIVISRNIMRRLEAINKTSRTIMGGDLSQRIPVAGSGDELDQLADNLNAMLEQIERLMTGMRNVTDNVAHDLRSPLNRLRNRLEVTLMSGGSQEEMRGALARTVEEVEAVIGTFNALLSIARVEAGSRREDMTEISSASLLSDIAELYEPVAEEKGIALTLKETQDAAIWANRELVSQALANLIDNALKYTPEQGTVEVSVRLHREGIMRRVEFSVADTGPGIPVEDRKRVLDRFVRLEASRNTPGSGLGLSLVAAVARLHDGRLDLGDSGIAGSQMPGLKASLILPAMK